MQRVSADGSRKDRLRALRFAAALGIAAAAAGALRLVTGSWSDAAGCATVGVLAVLAAAAHQRGRERRRRHR